MTKIIKNILFLMIIMSQALSHPHTFIEVKPTLNIKDTVAEKLYIKWIVDEMSSMMLIMELDDDGNGKFDTIENNYIYENYFLVLQKQNFYMKILSNKNNILINPKNFKASIENSKLVYSFEIEHKFNTDNLKIYFKDEELFVGMMLEKNYIKLTGVDKIKTENLRKNIFGIN